MNAIATASHQPAIQAVLDLYAKTDLVPVARATAALHVLLHDLYREPDAFSYGAAAIAFPRLTPPSP